MKNSLKDFRDFLLIIIIFLIIFIGMFFIEMSPHMALILALSFLSLWGVLTGAPWKKIEDGMIEGVSKCVRPLFILALIGMLISVWMLSGTVPTLFVYGIKMISPDYFLPSALIFTIMVSTFTGSSLTTVGTIGVALIGIAKAFSIPLPLAAGAIVCGAAFGDKVSPLSDTTNFAPGILDVDLFEHIKHLLWTTVPAILLSFIIFFLLNEGDKGVPSQEIKIAEMMMRDHFKISPLTLISPLIVIVLAMRRVATIPTAMIGIFTGLLTAGSVQGNFNIKIWFATLHYGFQMKTGHQLVDEIINRGGLHSMLFSISLVTIALAFGGVLMRLHILEKVISLGSRTKGKNGPIVLFSSLSGIGVNFLTGEQYLSILLPGQIFRPIYENAQIPLKTLSRTMEDSGTLINPLVPWGVCGVFMSTALGVGVSDYAPYAFFLYLSPLLTVLFSFLNIGQGKLNEI